MNSNQNLVIDPFNFIDTYQKEAFQWAESVWSKINSQLVSDNLDMEMVSIVLAKIHSDFFHIAFGISLDDFENYLSELYGEEKANEKFELMHTYRVKLYDAMLIAFGTDSNIFESLLDSAIEKNNGDSETYMNPLNFSQEGAAYTFVTQKFLY